MNTTAFTFCGLMGRLLLGLGLALASPHPAAHASPLVFSSGPLLEDADGWTTRGVPVVEEVADTGDGGWLTAWSRSAEPDGTYDPITGRVMARLLKPSLDGTPDLNPVTSFPPIELAAEQALNQDLVVVRGTRGGWVVWQSTNGLVAHWISAATGRAEGDPLVLAPGASPGSLLGAGDGTTAWIAWVPDAFSGTLHGVTLRSDDGPPRIASRFSLAGLSRFHTRRDLAASRGLALIVDVETPANPPLASTTTHQVNAAGEVLGAPRLLDGPAPDQPWNLYGVISLGTGWMIVWAEALTPLLPGRIVYGRVLGADGAADPATPLKALFVEPAGGISSRGLASANGTGVIVMARQQTEITESQAVVVSPDLNLSVMQLGRLQQRYGRATPALAVGFDGTHIALLAPQGKWRESPACFSQILSLATPTTYRGAWPVSRGAGLQEEPAVAWLPGKSVIAWQQISNNSGTPEILVRQRGPDGVATAPDIVVPQPVRGQLSSPALAANGNRLLLVARSDLHTGAPSFPPTDPDDVVGVLIENNTAITQPFVIAGGPGSQRAARVAAWGDGFCVAWREELNLGTTDYLSRIRCTFLHRDGTPATPGGVTLAAAVQELSSPALATNGFDVGVCWRRQWAETSAIEAVTLIGTSPDVFSTATIFPESMDARSPEIVWDNGIFLFTARLRHRDPVINSLGLARLRSAGTQAVILPPIPKNGREPVLASLGTAGTAVLWLDQVNGDATTLWMAVRDAGSGTTSTPEIVQRGRFDRDTLIARGDGRGRVLIAVHSNEPGAEGIRVFVAAPGVTDVPVLENLEVRTDRDAGPWPGFAFRWRPNVLFPARLQTVEASDDLTRWALVPDGFGAVNDTGGESRPEATFRTLSRLPNPQPAAPFYRLRAVLAE